MFVIDYAMVHDMAHLPKAKLTPRFWNISGTQVPRHEKARAWPRANGQTIEEDELCLPLCS